MRTILLLFTLHASADPWFGPDKVKHFFMSAFVTSVSYSTFRVTRLSHHDALAAAAGVALAVGTAKEVHDHYSGEGFSVRDLGWDLAGAASAEAVLTRAR